MSADGSIEIVFAGDLRKFRLGIAELVALQEKCGGGPYEIYARLIGGFWRMGDVVDTIRIALIGGGEDGKVAASVVTENVRPGVRANYGETRLGELEIGAKVASVILAAAITGVPDDPVGKAEAAGMATTSGSLRRTTTARARRSGLRPSKSGQ